MGFLLNAYNFFQIVGIRVAYRLLHYGRSISIRCNFLRHFCFRRATILGSYWMCWYQTNYQVNISFIYYSKCFIFIYLTGATKMMKNRKWWRSNNLKKEAKMTRSLLSAITYTFFSCDLLLCMLQAWDVHVYNSFDYMFNTYSMYSLNILNENISCKSIIIIYFFIIPIRHYTSVLYYTKFCHLHWYLNRVIFT